MKNVFLDIQSRQWRQVERWNVKQLSQFAEGRAFFGLRKSWSCRSVLENKQSTLAISFSCDGHFMASSHLTHEIVIHKTWPHLHILHTLPGHPSTNRSPWCLTFHPSLPRYLLSGCLGGSVILWDVQTGQCLCSWLSGVSCPINSLVFLPTHPDYILVACNTQLYLMHHCEGKMNTVWTSKTAAVDIKVRLVLHHPDSNKILTALTHLDRRDFPSCYQLQMFSYSFTSVPDLENSSTGLICITARVLSPQSVVLTSRFVISSSATRFSPRLSVYSIEQRTFGQCLFAYTGLNKSIVSLDLSPCERFLLLSLSERTFHMDRQSLFLKVLQVTESASQLNLEECCELSGQIPAVNVARWVPLQSGEGGVCAGTRDGTVVWWGRRRGRVEPGEVTRHCKLVWFTCIP